MSWGSRLGCHLGCHLVTPAQLAAARYPRGIGWADDGCAPDTGRQTPSDGAEKNALWDEAYDTMKSKTGKLAEKFEQVVMEEYDKMAKGESLREITRLQLTLDVPAQTTRDAIKTASRLLEMLQKQLSPVLELYPPAGLAFGGLCLVLRIVGFAITSQEETMKGLSHIAHAFDWYLQLSVSSLLQRQARKGGDVPPLPRPHALRSVTSSWRYNFKSLFRPTEFRDLLLQLENEERYFDGKVDSSIQTELLEVQNMVCTEQETTMASSVTQQFCSSEAKRGSRGILVVTSTRRTNPALAKILASTLNHGTTINHGRDKTPKTLIAHFASTDAASEHQFPKMAMELTHQLLCQYPELALGPVSAVRNYKGVEHNEELLLQSVVDVLEWLHHDDRVIFVLDLSRTLLVDDRDGFQQLIRKMFRKDDKTPQLIKLLITSHMDTGLNKFLQHCTRATSSTDAASSTGATSSTDANSFRDTISSTTEPLLGCSAGRSARTARGMDIQFVQSALLMISGACRPLILAELASSVAAYRAVTEGSNFMELIGSEELLSLLFGVGCLKYVVVTLQQAGFKTKTAAHEAAKVYGLGGVMPTRRAKLALAEASTFYLSQQVAGLTLEEVDQIAKDVATDLEKEAETPKSRRHCSAVKDSIINASFMCYGAEHSAPQLSEFPIYNAQDGSLRLRPSLQESQQQLWQPHHFCMRFWYYRLNALDPPIHDSYVAYLCYSRASGPISKDFGKNLFIAAAELGCPAFVTEGLRRDQNPNETNQFGHNALHIAAMHKDVAMSRTLLDEVGVDMLAKDALGFTPFHLAADLGKPQLLEVFFEAAQRRLNPSQILEFRSMVDSGPESRRRAPRCKCGYRQLIKRFIGKGMIYLACRRNPGLMQTFLELGIDAAKLRER
ncbi:putative ankyrin repeat protein [Phialemonium atrogriseum]|uniref:Ankyrin repeat protein n=1 Tax=Phialemonium atrogriseum TaxID=1093897 RepID=A0AAJ0FCH7_9PEZI|nr:putative ankyrin repeat protein [Phialemonium atrogriseum]KAK1763616.1 putative ankyrin repeat protein [Phialemonium atrogriseum]